MAGIDGRAVVGEQEATAALQEAVRHAGVGVVIITDAVVAEIRSQVDAIRLGCEQPLLVEIPGPQGPVADRKSLRQLVQEAVGIRISQEEECN